MAAVSQDALVRPVDGSESYQKLNGETWKRLFMERLGPVCRDVHRQSPGPREPCQGRDFEGVESVTEALTFADVGRWRPHPTLQTTTEHKIPELNLSLRVYST